MWIALFLLAVAFVVYLGLRSGKEAPSSQIDCKQLLSLLEESVQAREMRNGPSKDEKARALSEALKSVKVTTIGTLESKQYMNYNTLGINKSGYCWQINCSLGFPLKLPYGVRLNSSSCDLEFSNEQTNEAKVIETWRDGDDITLVWTAYFYRAESSYSSSDSYVYGAEVIEMIYRGQSFITKHGKEVANLEARSTA